jgi:DNA-binding LacI/PurR family transcriptional regulator
MDEAAGMRAMVGVLTEWGHRRFGFVGREVGANLRRRDALNRALEGMGVPWAAAFVFGSEKHDGHEAERVVAKFLKTSEPPTVLVAGEDAIALALLRAFSEAGVSVPNDLSLVGIDDIAASAQAIPPLTTLRQPIPDMAAAAFRVLSGKQKKYPISIPGELIVRKSCSRPKIS